jgi:YD repeat-containing protein
VAATSVAATPAEAQPVARSEVAVAAETPQLVTERPDETAARIAARIQGSRVEITDDRTETTTTWANPDGSLTTDSAVAPVRARGGDGAWKPIDYDLVASNGGFAPKVSTHNVWFSGGGSGPAMVAKKGSRELDLTLDKAADGSWGANLPAPTISGNTATYQLNSNVSLVLSATAAGLEESVVLAQAPAKSELNKLLARLHLRVGMKGLAAKAEGDGVAFAKASATTTTEPVITAGASEVHDAQLDADGDPTHAVTVPSTLVPDATVDSADALGVTDTSGAAPADLTNFLSDPSTVYPVTIDPSLVFEDTGDTYIVQGDTSGHGGEATLRFGATASGVARKALLRFNLSSLPTNAHVSSATLKVYQITSASCTAQPMLAYPIASGSWTYATTWANQPTYTSTNAGSATFSHGYSSSCPNAFGSINVTNMVAGWVAKPTTNDGVMLRAGDVNDPAQAKTICSRDPDSGTCNSSTKFPAISVTYEKPPSVPAAPVISTNPVSSAGYSRTTTPTLKGSISDPDGNAHAVLTIKNSAGAVVWTYTSGKGNNPFSQTVPAGKLTNGSTYTATVAAVDGYFTKTSAATTFTLDTTAPTATVTATKYTTGQWNTATPTSDTFKITGSADTATLSYSLNGAAAKVASLDSSHAASFTWTPVNGPNTITVTATDKAGNTGKSLLGFGTGPAGITQLVDHPVSTGTFPLQASAPGGATGATINWRFAGATAWTPADPDTLKFASNGSAWTGKPVATTIAGGTTAASTTQALMWDATAQTYPGPDGTDVNLTAPALIDLQVCFAYAGSVTLCAVENGAQLVPSAFGDDFPTTDMGPGQVALTTGEMALSESDAVDEAAGIDRTFSSYDPGTIASGPFGPGWSSSIESSADSSATLVDNRAQDGTFVLVTAGDASQIFISTAGANPTTPGAYPNGVTFAPLGVDDQTRLQLSHDGQTVTLTHPQSDASTWTYEPDQQTWDFQTSTDADTDDHTTVTYDQDHPAWIAETTAGDTAACTPTAQEPGCRALRLNYTGTGAATRISSVDLVVGATDGTGSTTRQATYSYAAGLLTMACGPDPDGAGPQTALCETYTYDTSTVPGRTLLATLTPPGQATWTFAYDGRGRLAKVTRPQASDVNDGGTATWSAAYDLSPNSTGLPDVSASAATVWGQDNVPTRAYAAFDPSYTPAGAPSADDVKHATLWFTDADGNTTNTATYGTITNVDGTTSSRWLMDATIYDHNGNPVATLDPSGIIAAQDADAAATAGGASTADALAAGQQVATDRSTVTVYSPDGSRISDEYGPAHEAYLKDGTAGTYRTHTHYVYDDQAPNLGGADKPAYDTTPDPDTGVEQTTFDLVVETDTSAADPDINPDGSGDHDTVVARNNYGPLVTGDGNGWTLGKPTQTSIENADGSFTVTSTTRYDGAGRPIEARQSGGSSDSTGAGNDAHATVRTYYSKTNTDPDCQIKGHADRIGWDGLLCKTGPAKQPTDPAGSGINQTLPVTWNQAYDVDHMPTLGKEVTGSTTRTTATVYDNLERPIQHTIDDGHDHRVENYGYDPATGAQMTVSGTGSSTDTGGTIKTSYDSWGRTSSYTDATGMVTRTTYTAAGKTAETVDDNGTTTYRYAADGTGDLTSATVSNGVGNTTFTAGYDADGSAIRVRYGDAIVATYGYDEAGNTTGLDYQNSNGDDLAGFTNQLDVNGLVQEANSTASASTQDYTYDNLGRLTNVQDTRNGTCTVRAYGFDATSDRTSLKTYGPANDGTCQNTIATSSRSWSYDDGNRITNTGYTYDDLGRTLSVPASDTNAATDTGASPLRVTYYADDMAASLAQTITGADGTPETNKNAFAVDATGRINQITTTSNGAEKTKETYEFGDDSGSPTAISTYTDATTDRDATTTLTRFVILGDLGMIASVNSNGTTYELTNLHGDAVATADDTSLINSYSETDEYGNLVNPDGAGSSPGAGYYNYLGSAQRTSGMVGGITLMGARLYDASTGQFFSIDAIYGGNPTAYDYPVDPVNSTDVSGNCSELIIDCTLEPPHSEIDKVVKKTPQEIGREGEAKAYEEIKGWASLFYVGTRWKLVMHPKSIEVKGQGRRFPDIGLKIDGAYTDYFEVKANSSRYTAKQKRKDAWINMHLGIPTHLWRVTIKTTKLVCVKNCPDLTA